MCPYIISPKWSTKIVCSSVAPLEIFRSFEDVIIIDKELQNRGSCYRGFCSAHPGVELGGIIIVSHLL